MSNKARTTNGLRWWGKCILHNCIIHPWLPLFDAIDMASMRHKGRPSRVASVVFQLHDKTAPVGGG